MKVTALSKLAAYLSAGFAAFFLPITWALFVVIIFVVVDTITGIMKAGKDSISNIKSRKAFSMVPKLTMYLLFVITGHACSYVDGQIPFVKLVLIGIGFIEVKSIDENFKGIFGVSFIDKIFEALRKLSKYKRA